MLGTGRALLVLDNCEHVALGCRELLDRILPDCPQSSVLTTSRIPLGMAGERIYAIPPLDMIGAGHDPNATDATALFVDRATGVAPPCALTGLNGRALADICRTLHGLPLAIELAASWIRGLEQVDAMLAGERPEAAGPVPRSTSIHCSAERTPTTCRVVMPLGEADGHWSTIRCIYIA